MRYLAASAALVGAVTSAAPAAITAFWQQNPITPAAIAASPILGSSQSWSLHVTTDGDWASAGMRAVLPSGTFFNHGFGGNTRPNPNLVAAAAGLAYDTYVTGPGDSGDPDDPNNNPPGLLGGHPAGSTQSFSGSTFSASWFNLTVDAPGTYEIARLTFPNNVVPTIFWEGNPPALPNSSNTSQVNPTSSTIIPQIPEPASLGLLAAVGLLAVRRRK